MENHSPHQAPDSDHGNPFFIPFMLISLFAIVELAGGVLTHSLALLSDAWHMVSDVMALGLAMFAAHRTKRARAKNRQSRSELIASFLNAGIMLVVIVWIVVEALARLKQPQPMSGGYVMLIALIGLIINVVVAMRLHHVSHHHGGKDNLNHRAALLHVMGDLLGSVAALAAGGVVYFTGWYPIDPILSIGISILLLIVTLSLIKDIYLRVSRKTTSHSHHGHHH
jgi:cobalt-zinc-cadmium efflux system protein